MKLLSICVYFSERNALSKGRFGFAHILRGPKRTALKITVLQEEALLLKKHMVVRVSHRGAAVKREAVMHHQQLQG